MTKAKLVHSSDPAAQPALTGKFQEVYARLDQNTRAITFVMQNLAEQNIAGYVVRWDVTNPAGLVQSGYSVFGDPYLFGKGAVKVQGLGLAPGDSRIITPSLNLSERDVDGYANSRTVQGIGASNGHSLSAEMAGYKATPILDAVVYQDGSYEGADTGDLAHDFAINRVAEHDAGYSILLAIHDLHETAEQLTARLQNVVNQGNAAMSGRTTKDKYLQARGREADVMLKQMELGGIPMLERNSKLLTQYPQINIHRVPSS